MQSDLCTSWIQSCNQRGLPGSLALIVIIWIQEAVILGTVNTPLSHLKWNVEEPTSKPRLTTGFCSSPAQRLSAEAHCWCNVLLKTILFISFVFIRSHSIFKPKPPKPRISFVRCLMATYQTEFALMVHLLKWKILPAWLWPSTFPMLQEVKSIRRLITWSC